MNLYAINNVLEKLLIEAIDPDTGEIDESKIAELQNLMKQQETATEDTALFIKNTKAMVKALKEEKSNLQDRIDRLNRQLDNAENILKSTLNGNTLNTSRVTVSYRKTKRVEIENPDKFINTANPKFLRIKPAEIDKVEVARALKAGIEIDGATLVDNVSMKVS